MQQPELVALAQSVEYKLFCDLDRINKAYMALCNAQRGTYKEAREALSEMRASSRDMERQIKQILMVQTGQPEQVFTAKRLDALTQDNLDSKYMNAEHFYLRYLHCAAEHKIKNLTSLYYLIRDVAELAEITPVYRYYREIV